MQAVLDEIKEKVSKLTPEEKSELLQRLLKIDEEIEENAKKSKAKDKPE